MRKYIAMYHTLRFYNSFSCANTCFWPPSINRFHGFPSQHIYVILGTTTIKGLENLPSHTSKKFLNMWRRIVGLLHFYDGRNQIIFLLSNRSLTLWSPKSFIFLCCSLQWDVNLWYWGNISKPRFRYYHL